MKQIEPPYILIVDDDEEDHTFLRSVITELIPGAKIESVFDGSEALAFFGGCILCPNIIFLDLNMSILSGQDTIKLLKKNLNLKDVPIIILSGRNIETEKHEVLALGASEFFAKPASKKELVNIVMEVLIKYDLWV